MADLSAVVNQLRQNNDDARYGNLQLNQNVEESRKENSGLQKLSESIIKNTASILKRCNCSYRKKCTTRTKR